MRSLVTVSIAFSAGRVGGSLIEILAEVSGLKTLPAVATGGSPSIPVKIRVGLQTLVFRLEIDRVLIYLLR